MKVSHRQHTEVHPDVTQAQTRITPAAIYSYRIEFEYQGPSDRILISIS